MRTGDVGLIAASCLLVFAGIETVSAGDARRPDRAEVRSRRFHLRFGGTIRDIPVGAHVRVWVPIPPSNDDQRVERRAWKLPTCATTAADPVYGNKMLFFEMAGPKSGRITFETDYLVERREVHALTRRETRPSLDPAARKRFLAPNRLVPTTGRPVDVLTRLLGERRLPEEPIKRARVLYDRVGHHVAYDKSRPGYGNGDANWVCDSGYGNCTDFHSLFIAWARANGLPAKFEIGFPLPVDRGEGPIAGYHCWGYFHAEGRGWIPVDIAEADKHPELSDYYFGNLTENRVAFSTGRDIELVPRQASGPLNYFVYPHIEVDGKPWPSSRTDMSVHFRDVATPGKRDSR